MYSMEILFLEYIDKKQKEFNISIHQIWLRSKGLYYYNDYLKFMKTYQEYRTINRKQSFYDISQQYNDEKWLFEYLNKYQTKIVFKTRYDHQYHKWSTISVPTTRPRKEYYKHTYNIINYYASAIRNEILGNCFMKRIRSSVSTPLDRRNYEMELLLRTYYLICNTKMPTDAIFKIISYSIDFERITDKTNISRLLIRNMTLIYKLIYKNKKPTKRQIQDKLNT